ncbi:hypothetical protein F5Y18DRAFT_417705 [Xylariaceae sp. FL1019]|nr:hypothetical protein F5Y18DRAFT_417705 [Xylariaceae sp. FL1019]
MANSSTDSYPVHLGVWINWSRGPAFGSTLTLRRRDGEFLTALTAFFIAYVATRFWRIACFVLHRVASTSVPQDAIYHQQQAILRNASSPEDGMRLLFKLMWTGRRFRNPFRPLPALVIASFSVIGFTIAGGFSSTISSSVGNEVLLRSSHCGYINEGQAQRESELFPLFVYGSQKINSAGNYAQQCYSSNATGLLDCSRFVSKEIVPTVDANASCPFRDELCRDNHSNIVVDSGYIDSHVHLGLNSPEKERILTRNVLHCAPLATEGYTSQANTTLQNVTQYHYGSTRNVTGYHDWLYVAESVEDQYSLDYTWANSNFKLDATRAIVKNNETYESGSKFLPIDAIFRSDADIHIIFLSGNGVYYEEASDDAWYRPRGAPTNVSFSANGVASPPGTQEFYVPSEPASPMGCTDQYQFCSTAYPGTSGCGPLASFRDALAGVAPFFDSDYNDFYNLTLTANFDNVVHKSKSAVRFLYFTATLFSIDRSIFSVTTQLGSPSLASQATLLGGIQYGTLPWNQWHQDVIRWWGTSMALTQSMFIDTAQGSSDPGLLKLHINFTDPEWEPLCTGQKIRSADYTSFSLFGLLFTSIVGALIIATSFSIEPLFAFLHRIGWYDRYHYSEWNTNGTLQLQRLAHEGMGLGSWSGCTRTVPMTRPNELLGSLDIGNLEHPVLDKFVTRHHSPIYRDEKSGDA